ncbi:CHAT domain-containing protein [Agrobacterium tomkonis]|uniref:CHAT domain-containing protein n=1 Tax=Agrobacterium tomkonis TaxID=1183410 RepID=UPI001CD87F32
MIAVCHRYGRPFSCNPPQHTPAIALVLTETAQDDVDEQVQTSKLILARQALREALQHAQAKDFGQAAALCGAAASWVPVGTAASRLLKAKLHVQAAQYLNRLPNRSRDAESAARAAISLLKGSPSADAWLARACSACGSALWYTRGAAAALHPFRRARKLLEAKNDSAADLALALDNEALCLHALGKTKTAIALQRRGLRIAQTHRLNERKRSFLRRMSNILQDQGHDDQAAELLAKAKPPSRASIRERVGWLHSQALLAEKRGLYSEAESWYDRATELFEEHAREIPDMVACLLNSALLKVDLDGEAQAKRLLYVADRLAPPDPPSSYFVKRGVADALAAARMGDVDEASRLFARTRERAIERNARNRAYELAIVSSHADMLREAGYTDDAEKLLRAALPSLHVSDRLGEEELAAALSLTELLLARGSEPNLAKKLLRDLVREALPRSDAESRWRIFNAIAELSALNGRQDSAICFGKFTALQLAESLASFPPGAHQRDAIMARRQAPVAALLRRLISQERLTEASRARAVLSVERARGAALRRDPTPVHDRSAFLTDLELAIDGEFGEALADARTASGRLADPFFGGARRREVQAKLYSCMEALTGIFDAAVEKTGATSKLPPFKKLQIAAAEITAPDLAVIRYFAEANQLFVQIETCRGTSQSSIAIVPQALTRIIFEFLEIVRHGGQENSASHELYRLLIEPLEPHLEHVARIEISSNGALSELPFAALHDGEGHLVERFAFASRSGAPRGTKRKPLSDISLFGASKSFGALPALKHVAAELSAAAGEFRQAKRYLDGRFTAKTLKSALSAGANVVHIAGHYRLIPGSPSRSFLLLGNGEKLPIATMLCDDFRWDSADLVFLSACETATGNTTFSEGETLAAALHLRGVSEIVATTWPVADDSTAVLAAKFYRELQLTSDASVALRRAQLSLLCGQSVQSTSGIATRALSSTRIGAPFSHPLHWAPFKLFVPGW